MTDFETKLGDILELDQLTDETLLSDSNVWDSLAVLSVIALVDQMYAVNIGAADLKELKTVGAIKAMIVRQRGPLV